MRVPCPRCCGTGQRPLTKVEATTIAVLTDEWQDTREVLAKLRVGRRRMRNTTVCNRLASLFSLGLVERQEKPDPERGEGRMLQWRLAPKEVR